MDIPSERDALMSFPPRRSSAYNSIQPPPIVKKAQPAHRYAGPEEECMSPTGQSPAMKPALTTLHLVAVTFLIAIGGPYGLEGAISSAGPLITIIFVLVLPFVWCLPTTLCVAELACSVPSNGGPIMWINVAFPAWFCLMVVMWSLVQQFVDNALYPSLATSYVESVFNLSSTGSAICKIAFVAGCCILNCVGVEIVGVGSIVIMVVALAPFVAMIVVFFTGSHVFPAGHLRWENIGYVPQNIDWATFLPLISWNMAGLDKSGNLAEEVRNPQTTFVRTLFVVILLIISVYVPPVMIGVSAWENPDWSKWQSGYWTNVSKHIGGEAMRWLLFAGGCASSIGYLLTNVCTTSRALASMGSIGVFPKPVNRWLGRYSTRFGTPINAIVANSVILCAFSILLEFDQLVAVDQILFVLRVMAIYCSVLILRSRYPTLHRPFQIPGNIFQVGCMLIIGFGYNIAMVVFSIGGDLQIFIISVGTVVGSFIASLLYVLWWRRGDVTFRGRIVSVIIDIEHVEEVHNKSFRSSEGPPVSVNERRAPSEILETPTAAIPGTAPIIDIPAIEQDA